LLAIAPADLDATLPQETMSGLQGWPNVLIAGGFAGVEVGRSYGSDVLHSLFQGHDPKIGWSGSLLKVGVTGEILGVQFC
jgi:hypothetical protein